jgi:membrane fusion protein, multidrug efflux system
VCTERLARARPVANFEFEPDIRNPGRPHWALNGRSRRSPRTSGVLAWGGWWSALRLALDYGVSKLALGRPIDQAAVTPECGMRIALIFITIVVLAVTGAALALGWEGALTRRRDPVTVDAYVEGDRTPLSSHVSGYVQTVLVHDNQSVRAGDMIVQMEDDDYRAQAAEAQAQADAARTALAALGEKREVLQQQVVQAQDTVTAANDQLVHAVNETHRQQELLPTAFGLLQGLQTAQADQRRAEATRAQGEAQVLVNQRQLDLLDAQILQAKAQTSEADAQNKLAQIALGYTRIVAPIDGTLGVREVHEGALLSPGTQVDTITPLDTVYVTANFTERQITNIRIGQRAIVRVDAFRNVPVQGKVAGIQPATGSQVSLVPADNSTGNFTKIVQRIPVKISLDLAETHLIGRVLPGMSARVEVITDTAAPEDTQ